MSTITDTIVRLREKGEMVALADVKAALAEEERAYRRYAAATGVSEIETIDVDGDGFDVTIALAAEELREDAKHDREFEEREAAEIHAADKLWPAWAAMSGVAS